MLGEILTVVAPVWVCAALGYFWAKAGRPYATEMATELIANVGTPCLIFSALLRTEVDPVLLGRMGLAMLAAFILWALLGALLLRAVGLSLSAFLPSLMFPNTGTTGVPICYFAFGEKGLALALACMTATVIVHFSVGAAIASGEFSPKRLAKTPALYAVAISVLFLWRGWGVPRWLANTTRLIGDLTIPLMIITLGVSLERLRGTHLGRSALLAMARLALGLIAGFGLGQLFGFQGIEHGVFILECAMPVAVFNYLFAQYYNRSAQDVAGVVLSSAALAVPAIPLLLAYLM